MKEFKLPSSDGKTKLACYMWEPEGYPKAILQIIHGMSEYVLRYEAFAKFCNEKGILVVGDDHLGHGHSAANRDELGFFAHEEGYKRLVEDEQKLRESIQALYPGVPYVMMGHSMGSFIMRNYLTSFDTSGLSASIIMGTAGSNPALKAGMALTKSLIRAKGERHRSKLVTALAFGSYGKGIDNPVNHYAWLTRDEDVCRRYAKDPFCNYKFTLSAYYDMFKLIEGMSSDSWYEKVPKELPLLLIAGKSDPVGNFGKGVEEVYDKLQKQGCKVDLKLYDGMRHEVLNEFGKEEVYSFVRGFILKNCGLEE